jgi:large repetitive protein
LFSNTFGTDGNFIEPKTLSATGTYTVTVDPQGAATGSVTLTYYVVPADATAVAPNPLTINTPGQNGVITFSVTGAAADRTFTVSTTVPPSDPCCADSIELKVFSGSTQVGISEFAGPSGYTFTRNLAAGPTYTIVVDPFGASTGSVTVTVS